MAGSVNADRFVVASGIGAGAGQVPMNNNMVDPWIVSRSENQFLKYDAVNGFQLITAGTTPTNYLTSAGGTIILREGLSLAKQFSVLVHELAHEMLHQGERKGQVPRRVRELEAEAVAFVISEAIGLDTNTASADYIQLYHGDKELLMQSLGAVRQAAAQIQNSSA